MKVVDIANEIYIDAGSPSDTSIPAIAFWIRTKTGWLNTILYEDFVVNDGFEIINATGAEISPEAVSIVKQLYKLYDLEVQVRKMMNAIAADGILSVTDNLGGTSFTRVNRNEVAKTLIMLRKDENDLLQRMIDSYRSLMSQPSQVAGDDTTSGYTYNFPSYRPLWGRSNVYSKY